MAVIRARTVTVCPDVNVAAVRVGAQTFTPGETLFTVVCSSCHVVEQTLSRDVASVAVDVHTAGGGIGVEW